MIYRHFLRSPITGIFMLKMKATICRSFSTIIGYSINRFEDIHVVEPQFMLRNLVCYQFIKIIIHRGLQHTRLANCQLKCYHAAEYVLQLHGYSYMAYFHAYARYLFPIIFDVCPCSLHFSQMNLLSLGLIKTIRFVEI